MKNVDWYSILAPVYKNATLTSEPKKSITVAVYDPCSEYYLLAYLNSETVQKAIHVKPTNLQPHIGFSSDLLHKILSQGVRIIVYSPSGDLDLVVPVTGTIQVIKNMNLTVEKLWRQWFSGREVGGFTEEYKGNFTFATVRAACHSVLVWLSTSLYVLLLSLLALFETLLFLVPSDF
ncbi:hypothetical protein IGI04_012348 [Brassica rapa subsp. trilocularis]|uniref:Uncharacterized protein n=1 Tax=Brassica rapa subsp. trilocularis TaxID=1813537 RepID=A0ABQ7N8Y8_BRACM|nr:hypothetical protein IGI04_012348 [Brassica rapa subsp. trilocularis]